MLKDYVLRDNGATKCLNVTIITKDEASSARYNTCDMCKMGRQHRLARVEDGKENASSEYER